MSAKIETLANQIRSKQKDGVKYVVMLGAGASLSSVVKLTREIMEELLEKYGQDIPPDPTEVRFDQLWRQTSPTQRERYLKLFLGGDLTPSEGYQKLAALIKAGYFDIVVSFNFDCLLEKALADLGFGFGSLKIIISGETDVNEIAKLVDAPDPRFKLLKLHGSLKSSNHLLFNVDETREFPEPVAALVRRLTERDIMVCGYGFEDLDLLKSFAKQGESIVSVNPSAVPRYLRGFMKDRRSEQNDIRSDFDSFFIALHWELMERTTETERKGRPPNPFKFLESYEESDQENFKGRESETADFLSFLQRQPPPDVIVVAGSWKAGKTSLTRAGLLASLDRDRYDPIYVRCDEGLGQSLPLALGLSLPVAAALRQRAVVAAPRRAVVFLDQFECVTDQFDWRDEPGKSKLAAFLKATLLSGLDPNLTQVWVVTDQANLGTRLFQECKKSGNVEAEIMECDPFGASKVADIVRTLAKQGAVEFPAEVIDDLAQRYGRDRSKFASTREDREHLFTLVHVQAICHILAGELTVDFARYQDALEKNVGALNKAINYHDIMSFVENCSWPDAAWLRNMIKVPLTERKERIAEYIKQNYEKDLRPRPPQSAGSR